MFTIFTHLQGKNCPKISLLLLAFLLSIISIHAQPANDLCENAEAITSAGGYSGTTVGATAQTPLGGSDCGNSADALGNGVWYTFVGDGTSLLLEFPETSGWDPEINVYSGACGAYVCETGDDDSGPGFSAQVTVNTANGTQYWVYVHGASTNQVSAFTFTVTGTVSLCSFSGSAASTNVTCPGGSNGSITVTTSSPNPITYELSGAATATNTNGSFTGLTAGAYTVTYYETANPSCSLTENLTINNGVDNTPPSVSCFGNQIRTTSNDGTGNCQFTGTIGGYSINDNCSSTLSVNENIVDENGATLKNPTFNLSHGSWAPVGDYPVGVNVVTITATDGAGLSASCSFTVTITDDEAPTAA